MRRDGAMKLGLKDKTGQQSWVREKRRSNETGSVRRDGQRNWALKIRPDSKAGSVGNDRAAEIGPSEGTGSER
jgi:hypothetical protein